MLIANLYNCVQVLCIFFAYFKRWRSKGGGQKVEVQCEHVPGDGGNVKKGKGKEKKAKGRKRKVKR
jgi:hypothetical protein